MSSLEILIASLLTLVLLPFALQIAFVFIVCLSMLIARYIDFTERLKVFMGKYSSK